MVVERFLVTFGTTEFVTALWLSGHDLDSSNILIYFWHSLNGEGSYGNTKVYPNSSGLNVLYKNRVENLNIAYVLKLLFLKQCSV